MAIYSSEYDTSVLYVNVYVYMSCPVGYYFELKLYKIIKNRKKIMKKFKKTLYRFFHNLINIKLNNYFSNYYSS